MFILLFTYAYECLKIKRLKFYIILNYVLGRLTCMYLVLPTELLNNVNFHNVFVLATSTVTSLLISSIILLLGSRYAIAGNTQEVSISDNS